MDETLEHPDDGLRDRIRKGFESSNKLKSKKIEDRPKTPLRSNKGKRAVTISKKVTEIPEEKIESIIVNPIPSKKAKMEKKPVVRKPVSGISDAMKQLTIKQTKGDKTMAKPSAKKPEGVYLCPKCDKTYKSKNGIVKHMEKCK